MKNATDLSECAECGGVTALPRMTLDQWWGEELFLFENVPVRLGRDCGEVDVEAEVSNFLQTTRDLPALRRGRNAVRA